MRLFVAIDPPDDVRDALATMQGDLTVGRKADPDTFHLTLAFLGDQSDDAAEAVHDMFSALRAPDFDLELSGLGTFGGAVPAVVFAGVADAGPVTALRDSVRRRIRAAGITIARERFRPHVTLARFGRRPAGDTVAALRLFMARNAGFRTAPFRVGSFALYQSQLGPDGPRHEALARYPLG
ncbi:MAG: RNA 2',3'-cyclic phosphodiesterase [Pseudooceanicola sp.]